MRKLLALFTVFAMACSGCAGINAATKLDDSKDVVAEPGVLNQAFDLSRLFQDQKPVQAVVCDKHPCVTHHLLDGEIDEESVREAVGWIEAANAAGADRLILEINTPGGYVDSGFSLSKALENSKTKTTIVVDGKAASMGFYILQSADERIMTKRSNLMAHEPSIGGEFKGYPNEWQAIANHLKASRDAMAEHCAHRMKISLEEYHAKTDGGLQFWLTWEDAMKYAAVDSVVVSVKEVSDRYEKKN